MEYKYSNNSYDTMPTTVNDTKVTIIVQQWTLSKMKLVDDGQQSGEFPPSDNKNTSHHARHNLHKLVKTISGLFRAQVQQKYLADAPNRNRNRITI